MKDRTKAFALRVIRLYSGLPKETVAQVLGKQVLRSATSVGANYRAACRAKSAADFRAGRQQAFQFLVGQAMKLSRGRANVERVNALLREKLSS